MDQDAEMKRMKVWLYVGLVFLISAIFSWQELKYTLRGKSAEATVTTTNDFTEHGRHDTKLLSIHYRFDDAGVMREEYDHVPLDWPTPEVGSKVQIQYFPGVEDSSRILGHSNKFWVYIFLGSCAVGGFLFFQLMREVKS